MRIFVLLSIFLLTSCTTIPGAVRSVGDTVDEALDAGRIAFCSKRFSLRAYEDFALRHGKTAEDVREWCGWDLDSVIFTDPLVQPEPRF